MKSLTPVALEAVIARVADDTYVLRNNRGVTCTAQTFGKAVKLLREFFDEEIKRPRDAGDEDAEAE